MLAFHPTLILPTHLAASTPADVLLRLRAAGVEGVILLESLGPVTPRSARSFLSAAPVAVQHHLPEWPAGSGMFPAWLGGLHYEAAHAFGLTTHPASSPTQTWGLYPSGLVWQRDFNTDNPHASGQLSIVGEPHLDWMALLGGDPAPTPPLEADPLLPGDDHDLEFEAGVRTVQTLIRAGEVYQVNLSRGLSTRVQGDPLAAYLRLRTLNPSPFMAYAELPHPGGLDVVVSGSPEQLVRWERASQQLTARPIAGTRPRGSTPASDAALEAELRSSRKEVAEHLMLVDLLRHDLGAAAVPGAVWVPELLATERYSHVMHLVSEVAATARADLTLPELLSATFPGGTITGAPKRRVMEVIAELEPRPRRWYTGSLGRISGEAAELNILIRTAAFTREITTRETTRTQAPSGTDRWQAEVRAGAGIVIGSQPRAETGEVRRKAQATLLALGLSAGHRSPGQPPAAPIPGRVWRPAPALLVTWPGQRQPRVLLLDNFDSFTHNLAHDLHALGASVIWRNQTTELGELLALAPDAVLIGPGPGTPQSSGVTLALTQACLKRQLPLLGVCLGHQALGEVLGGKLGPAPQPIHGEAAEVHHAGTGLFEGLPSPAAFGRYHSLTLGDVGAGGRVTARSSQGEVMALEAVHHPAWSVQFHPESLLSPHGRALLARWLTMSGEWGSAERSRAEVRP